MRIAGVKTAKAVSRWFKARLLGGAMILGYHRVANVISDEYEVCITSEHFAEQMEVVSKYGHPVSLSKLVQQLKNGMSPAKSIAITFDDGYADNLYQAKPVLEKYGIPATVFVCTGYAGKEFWWDELERLVMHSNVEPCDLRLETETNSFQWKPSVVSPEAGSLMDTFRRRQFRHALYNFILCQDIKERNLSMDVVRKWAGPLSQESLAHRAMNQTELLQLTEGGLIELGSHTRSHPMLPQLTLERQVEEITSGKKDLEDLWGREVAGFAYPNGRSTQDAKRIVQEAGFTFACTSLHDMVRPGCDLFELTRFWQKDVDGESFMRSLNLWMK